MQARKLAVEGAIEFTPRVFPDDRGLFVSPYQEEAFIEAHGGPLFPVAQTNHSRSKRGVVRGIHYTVTPPGTAKYVYCPRGKALDIVVDIRVGSPTFGKWDAVLMDQEDFRTMYFPVGVGHAFVALEDDTVMSYMISSPYVAENELALSPLDPVLGLPIDTDVVPILSERDTAALTLGEAEEQGMLPDYDACQEIERRLSVLPLSV
ncbi:dTDP-4-dehydrorhamnose 3,5-epimerase family protein [Amycolatopsis roodepoortensis]|uniref:dTDP-4-dehydrorhamnose 3,5-epimerase family protein n=1 Tax=Amycolatopsis roodepoortensis TaxID=700274 RepID=UPI00214C8F16|nr:dTDP-4-dehydrorhamnose 3,5-epimerase family protein [Amycolatopsis roodepoortensis]UUV34768.1 dTDP-4-dehydrorhamnose 3,5-epimerase family protein [Amycolatopsis roodepoortensis]